MKNYILILTIVALNASALSAQYMKGYGVKVDTQCDPDGNGVTFCHPMYDTLVTCELNYKLVHPNGDTSDIEGAIVGHEICVHLDTILPIGEYRILVDFAESCGQPSQGFPSDTYFFWSGCLAEICGEHFFSGDDYPIGPEKVFKIPANAKRVVCGIQNHDVLSDTTLMFIDGIQVASLVFCEKPNDGGLCGPLVYDNGKITQYDKLDFPYYDSLGVSGDRPFKTALFIMDIPEGSCAVSFAVRTKNAAKFSQIEYHFRCYEYHSIDTIYWYDCNEVEFQGKLYTSDTLIFTKLWEDQYGCVKAVYHQITIGSADVYKDVDVCPGDTYEGVVITSDMVLEKTITENGCPHQEITYVHVRPSSGLVATIVPNPGFTDVTVALGTAAGAQIFLDGKSVQSCLMDGLYTVSHPADGNHNVSINAITELCEEKPFSVYFIQKNGSVIFPFSPDGGENFVPPTSERKSIPQAGTKRILNISGQEIPLNQDFLPTGIYYILDEYGTVTKVFVR